MSAPRVSVLVPVYQTAQYVAEALDSVLNQTFQDYEIIVVNDGSPDSELLDKVLWPYRAKITYIVQENRGSSAARNAGLSIARAAYVAMLDSDDRWHPEYLASQLAVLERDPTADVVYPDAVRFTEKGVGKARYSDLYPVGGEITFARVLARKCQIYGEVTARREVLMRVGMYDEMLQSGEDYELWLRILKSGGRIVYNDRVLAYYRTRSDSHTANAIDLATNVLKVLDKVERHMQLTTDERLILEAQRAGTVAMLRLSEGKDALIAGDGRTAIAKFEFAAAYYKSWKLRATIAALRIAPRVLCRIYQLREAKLSKREIRPHATAV